MFTMKINLGNDAMRTRRDVAKKLREVAARLDELSEQYDTDNSEDDVTKHTHRIQDDNGKLVGVWTYNPWE